MHIKRTEGRFCPDNRAVITKEAKGHKKPEAL
jgi:hypothetical protein